LLSTCTILLSSRLATAQIRADAELRYSQQRLPMSDTRFSGFGKDGNDVVHNVSAAGSEIGLARPRFQVFEVAAGLRGEFIYMVITTGFGFASSDASASDLAKAAQFNTSSIGMLRMALEPGFHWQTGPIRLSSGVALGFRSLWMRLGQLESIPDCSGCGGSSSAMQGLIAPRCALDLLPGSGIPLGIGVFAATDFLRPQTAEIGAALSMQWPQ
jgi:hypothetical protein